MKWVLTWKITAFLSTGTTALLFNAFDGRPVTLGITEPTREVGSIADFEPFQDEDDKPIYTLTKYESGSSPNHWQNLIYHSNGKYKENFTLLLLLQPDWADVLCNLEYLDILVGKLQRNFKHFKVYTWYCLPTIHNTVAIQALYECKSPKSSFYLFLTWPCTWISRFPSARNR